MAISKKGKDASRAERKANKRKLEDAIPDLPDDNEAVELPEAPSGTEEKGSKKRKRNNDEHDTTENGAALGDVQRKAAKKKREEKKRLRSKKDKFVGDDENIVKEENKSKKAEEADQVNEGSLIQIAKPEDSTEDAAAPRRSKKERKAERKARETAEAAANKAVETTPLGLALVPDGKAAIAEEKKSKKNNRNRERKRKGVNDQAKVVDGSGDIAKAKPARFIVFIGEISFLPVWRL
jgi:nucleolar protein 6